MALVRRRLAHRAALALTSACVFVGCAVDPLPRASEDPAVGPGAAVPPGGPAEGEPIAPVVDVAVPVADTGAGSDAETRMGVAGDAAPVVVFLNRAGRAYYAGADDSARGYSSVLSYYGTRSVQFPASSFSDAQWSELLARVRAYYAPFAVRVVDARPTAGIYTEIAVGNAWASSIGLSNNIGGIAPLGPCRTVPGAVGFVFTPLYMNPGYGGVAGVAEAVAHEVGHTLSLSHESLATDLMSYAPQSASKSFQDQASYCGTSPGAESCTCGAQTQNSHQQLLRIVGASTGAPSGGGDTKPPTVDVVTPKDGATLDGNATIEITAQATDDVGVAQLQLFWAYTGRLLPCDDSIAGVTCAKSPGRATWRIQVGTGSRQFYAVATDTSGNAAQSALRTITLGGAAPAPTDAPPEVSPTLPTMGATLARGSDLVLQARVTDDKGVGDVRAVWGYNGGSLEYVLAPTTTPGLYQATTTVSAQATPGPRTITFYATDTAGQRTTTKPLTVQVQ